MFYTGKTSKKRLIGVHPYPIAVINLALLKYSRVDFGVGAGAVRTRHQQQMLVDDGLSKILNSLHCPQRAFLPDNIMYSHAVDLYPSGFMDINKVPDEIWIEISNSLSLATDDLNHSINVKHIMDVQHGMNWKRTEKKLGWDCPHHEWRFKVGVSFGDVLKYKS